MTISRRRGCSRLAGVTVERRRNGSPAGAGGRDRDSQAQTAAYSSCCCRHSATHSARLLMLTLPCCHGNAPHPRIVVQSTETQHRRRSPSSMYTVALSLSLSLSLYLSSAALHITHAIRDQHSLVGETGKTVFSTCQKVGQETKLTCYTIV